MSEAYQKALRQDGCACGQSPSCLRQPCPSNMAKWRSSPGGFLGRDFGFYAVCDNCKRYAKADASKAEEPRHDLSLPLAEADAHTPLLSESAEGAISSVVASLSIGDRVELEWLQMRLPGAAFDSEPVRVCPKLARVTEAEEKALIEQWCQKVPAPGLVSGVPRPAPICAPCKPAKPPPSAAVEPPAPPAPR